MNKFLIAGLLGLIAGCSNKLPDSATVPSGRSDAEAADTELRWSPMDRSGMTWNEAFTHCGAMTEDGLYWRLPSPKEFNAKFGYPKEPDLRDEGRMWSSLWHESWRHYSISVQNGSKSWTGDDSQEYVYCVANFSAQVDPEAWLMELRNAKVMNAPEKSAALMKLMAASGMPAAQLQFGQRVLDEPEAPPKQYVPPPEFAERPTLVTPSNRDTPAPAAPDPVAVLMKVPSSRQGEDDGDVLVTITPSTKAAQSWLDQHAGAIRDASIKHFKGAGIPSSNDDPSRPQREAALLSLLKSKTPDRNITFTGLSITVDGFGG